MRHALPLWDGKSARMSMTPQRWGHDWGGQKKPTPDFATGKNPGRLPGRLRLEDSHDLMRTRVNDEAFIADHDVVIATPLGLDHEAFRRQRVEVDAVRNARSYTYRDVKLRRWHLVLSDDAGDFRTLLGREVPGARFPLTGGTAFAFIGGFVWRRSRTSTAFGRALRLHVGVAIGFGGSLGGEGRRGVFVHLLGFQLFLVGSRLRCLPGRFWRHALTGF